jgi:hypothetical protein
MNNIKGITTFYQVGSRLFYFINVLESSEFNPRQLKLLTSLVPSANVHTPYDARCVHMTE